jgi:phage-related protein
MFINKVLNKPSKNLNVVKVDGTDLENIGLYLEKDFELIYTEAEEIEEIYIPGRNMPYHRHVRDLPIEFDIPFYIKDSNDFYNRINYIKNFLESKKETVITFNKEDKGFKLYYVTIGEVKRAIGNSTIKIEFMCYPEIHSLEN